MLLSIYAAREGVRGVAGVASATPYFGHIRIGSNKKLKYKKNLTFLYLRKKILLHHFQDPNAFPGDCKVLHSLATRCGSEIL